MSDVPRLATALSGRYAIERELGAGGMATVYLAHDVRHDRKVALKVLRPELAAILGAERFLQEIRTTANLQHPHILPLHDSGEVDGTVYYVMPFVEGESLRDRLVRDKQLPVEDAIRVAREVADALEYAHQHGVVHRDIKPENILLHGGHALVADFGIALAVSTVGGGTRMTETGMSLGTPHYMAPEQAMGDREITPRADIYALGVVLYEMLTGDPPFTGSTAQAIVARVVTEHPRSLTSQRHTVAPNVEAAVLRALEKLPADRFASAAQFSAALGNPEFAGAGTAATARAGGGQAARPPRWRFFAPVAAGAMIALVGGFLAGRRSAPPPPLTLLQFTVDVPDSVQAMGRCCGRAIALSPNGETLVFVGTRGSGGPLFRRSLGRLDAAVIPGTDGATLPFFSPDGRWLAFYSDGRLRKVSMAGGPAIPIAAAEVVSGASWGDGDIIVFAERGRLRSVSAAGGQPRDVATPDSSTSYMYPFVLPGGSAALVSVRSVGSAPEAWRIGVVDLAGGALDTVAFGGRAEFAAGHLVFSGADNTLLAQPFDIERRRTTGDAVAILDRIRLSGSSNHEFTVSASRSLAYLTGAGESGEHLRVSGPGGRTSITLPGRPDANFEDPAISPNGRLIALRLAAASGGPSASQDIWLLDRQQGTLERFTVGGGAAPVWSRDGRSIAYTAPDSGAHGPPGLYVRAADQTDAPRLLLRGGGLFAGSWMPDGRTIVFQAQGRPRTFVDIGSVGIGDSAPRWLIASEFRERQGQVSRDGRWLAHSSDRTGQSEVYVQPLAGAGGRVQVSTSGGSAPRWSPDGRTLYYVEGASLIAATLAQGPGFRVLSRRTVVEGGITDLNGANVNWDVFPNGREFLHIDFLSGGASRPVWMLDWPALANSMRTGR